jgi:hypothetical protein
MFDKRNFIVRRLNQGSSQVLADAFPLPVGH